MDHVKETAVSFEYEAPSADEYRNRIRTITPKYPYPVYETDGVISGYACNVSVPPGNEAEYIREKT